MRRAFPTWSRRLGSAAWVPALTGLLSAGTAAAQGLRPYGGVALGKAVPTSDFHAAASGQGFNSGWETLVLVGLTARGCPVQVRAEGSIGTHGANGQLKSDLTAAFGQASDEKTQLLGGTLGLAYPFGLPFHLQSYAFAGVGAYRVKVTVTSGDSTAAISGTRAAWNLGAGLFYRLRGPAPFLEARYVNVSAVSGFPKTTFLSIVAGLRLPGR